MKRRRLILGKNGQVFRGESGPETEARKRDLGRSVLEEKKEKHCHVKSVEKEGQPKAGHRPLERRQRQRQRWEAGGFEDEKEAGRVIECRRAGDG